MLFENDPAAHKKEIKITRATWKITSSHFSLFQVVLIHGVPHQLHTHTAILALQGDYGQDVATQASSGVEPCAPGAPSEVH